MRRALVGLLGLGLVHVSCAADPAAQRTEHRQCNADRDEPGEQAVDLLDRLVKSSLDNFLVALEIHQAKLPKVKHKRKVRLPGLCLATSDLNLISTNRQPSSATRAIKDSLSGKWR